MKTKITLLIAFVSLSFTSCIKDFHGHPDDENGILTEFNYFYADDFKTEFLAIRIAQLDEEIGKLLEGGASEEDDELIAARQQRKEASDETIALTNYRDFVFRRRPPIPGPCPRIELCFPNIQYVTLQPNVDSYELTVIDANNNIIGTTEGEPTPLDNVGGLLNYVIFLSDNEDYQGDVQIRIKEKLSDSDVINEFTLDATIGE